MKMEPPIISDTPRIKEIKECDEEETPDIGTVDKEENLEEILEDISSTVTTIYTPRRKTNYSVLNDINFSLNLK